MDIFWDKTAWDDYIYWQETDRKILNKINSLIEECQRTPFAGSGNPKPLKQNLNGFWSRLLISAEKYTSSSVQKYTILIK